MGDINFIKHKQFFCILLYIVSVKNFKADIRAAILNFHSSQWMENVLLVFMTQKLAVI